MATKRTSKDTTVATVEAVVHFSPRMWRDAMNAACMSEATSVKQILTLILQAREAECDPEMAREAIKEAYAAGYAHSFGVAYNDALSCKTVANRVSDAMAIFNAKVMPGSLASTLQAAAKQCREANPKTGGKGSAAGSKKGANGKPRAPGQAGEPLTGLELMELALKALATECEGNDAALSVVDELKSLSADLILALLDEEPDTGNDEVLDAA